MRYPKCGHPPTRFFSSRGMTLVEVMIALVILTVGVLSFLGAFAGIARGIRVSKASTLASNLAQEEIESLKNLSYYRLLVTTATATAAEPGLGGFAYDTGYYPPEELVVGQITFERRVLVQKVAETAGEVVDIPWGSDDTGLKLITAYVIWQEANAWKKIEIKNLRDNPNRKKIDAAFAGTVKTGITNLQDATVTILQNPALKGITTAAGEYEINLPAGTYDLRATKAGFFPMTLQATVATGGSQPVNFNLVGKARGGIQGFAYLNTHLLLSKVCASVDGDDTVEFVQLYNPTSQAISLFDGTEPAYRVEYVRGWDGAVIPLNPEGHTLYAVTTIAPGGYFLLSSSFSVQGVNADAYYSNAMMSGNVPANRFWVAMSGGIRLVSNGVHEASGTVVDAVGWSRGGSPWGPAAAREGTGLSLTGGPGHNGLAGGETIERIAYSTSTHSMMDVSPSVGIHASYGNAFDSDSNSADWVHHDHSNNEHPQNSFNVEPAHTGTPAVDAGAFVDDGLSSSAFAMGIPTPGSFTVTNIATGTWNLLVSSSGWMYVAENIVITAGNQIDLGGIRLSAPATYGFAAGRVVDDSNQPIPNITVEVGGVGSDTTGSDGTYALELYNGTFTVTANPDNQNSDYTTGTATGVYVTLGAVRNVPDIVLFEGGGLIGFVTTNGTDPLPGVPMIASSTASGGAVASAVTDQIGLFRFRDLPIGQYELTPQLETGESSNPTSFTRTVLSGVTVDVGTMTVSNAFGTLRGTLTAGSQPVTTGALIVAVPTGTSLGAYPPDNNDTLRNGSVVYYVGSSNSDGTYAIPLRGGTYNVKAWYTTFNGETPDVQPVADVAVVPAGGETTVNFTW